MVNHFEPMRGECPHSGNCKGEPFSCGKCRKNPKNNPFSPSPHIIPFRYPFPNTTPSPTWREPRWEYTCRMR